jgi:hypothetical protein
MSRPFVNKFFSIGPPNIPGVADWHLKNLHINFALRFRLVAPREINSSSNLSASISRQCAPTLESLVWRTHSFADDVQSFGTDPSNIPQFTKLRSLVLDNTVAFEDPQSLNALLLQAPLRHLAASTGGKYGREVKEKCFGNRGRIPTLESFIWTKAKLNEEHSLDFLRSNNQLLRLCVAHAIPGDLAESNLLPLLSTSFRDLTALDLSFKEIDISASALKMISSIRSLENLQICASLTRKWSAGWPVDHEHLREHLSTLRILKKFSVWRDVYNGLLHHPSSAGHPVQAQPPL